MSCTRISQHLAGAAPRALSALMLSVALAATPAMAAQKAYPHPVYVASCTDVPDSWPARKAGAAEHLGDIDKKMAKFALGGPVVDEAGKKIVGSMIIYQTGTLAEAKAMLASDAYARMGVFKQCTWQVLVPYVGSYVGGWAGPGPNDTPPAK